MDHPIEIVAAGILIFQVFFLFFLKDLFRETEGYQYYFFYLIFSFFSLLIIFTPEKVHFLLPFINNNDIREINSMVQGLMTYSFFISIFLVKEHYPKFYRLFRYCKNLWIGNIIFKIISISFGFHFFLLHVILFWAFIASGYLLAFLAVPIYYNSKSVYMRLFCLSALLVLTVGVAFPYLINYSPAEYKDITFFLVYIYCPYLILDTFLFTISFVFMAHDTRIKKTELERKQIVLEQQVYRSELKALKRQIDPHLIQNTFEMAAIKLRKGDTEDSVGILKRISIFFRHVLNLSEESVITIEQELEYSEEYLKLQQTLNPGLFEYEIPAPDIVDKFDILVPPMLFQPALENCIKHGFSKIENGGRITIKFEINDRFRILIIDNGMGLQEMTPDNNKSFGIELTKRRVQTAARLVFNKPATDVSLCNREDGEKGAQLTIEIPLNNYAE